ncbi:MAG: ATP-binding protein [Armatimonadetes bacterium]|nr:ATP-binding protein [Armatimonadota bacterium]
MKQKEKTIVWRESASRRIVAALCSSFTSISHAVCELVDNAVDAMDGQQCRITVELDKPGNRIVVESAGGLGMGAMEIATFLNWGEGAHHSADDIGHYGQGGKAACGYLGDSLRIWSKRAGESDIWMFEDLNWRSRADFADFGTPEPVDASLAPESLRNCPVETGCVRIEVEDVINGRHWRVDSMTRDLATVYDRLLRLGRLAIVVNGTRVEPIDLPLDASVGKVPIDVKVGDVTAKGWAARLERSKMKDGYVKAGFRLFAKGRMMVESESFGFHFAAKGSLNQFVAELEIDGLTPNLNKSGFVESDDQVFKDLGRAVLAQCTWLIKQLREGHDEKIVGREKKTAARVRRQLKALFKEIAEGSQEERASEEALGGDGDKGRKRMEPKDGTAEREESQSTGRTNKARTEAPDGAVGTLRRVLRRLKNGKDCPEIEIVAGSPEVRSAFVEDEAKTVIQVNKNFPAYVKVEGAESYVAETALIELLLKDEDCQLAPALMERLNFLLVRWSSVASADDQADLGAA